MGRHLAADPITTGIHSSGRYIVTAAAPALAWVATVSARSVSANAQTAVYIASSSENHLREYARPSARPSTRAGHHANTQGSKTNSTSTPYPGNQPSTGSSNAIKDVSRGDCRSPMNSIVCTPASDDQANSAAGMSNHGAIARVASPRNTSDNSATDRPISLAMI